MEKTILEPLAEDALDAFWDVVARRYPQARTGDLSPLTSFALNRAAERAIEEWVDNNVPTDNHHENAA